MKALIKTMAGLVALVTVVGSVSAQAEQEMSKDRLVGAWRLVAFKAVTGDQVTLPLGERPGGFVGFSPTRFWVMLVDSTRKPPAAAALTDAEAVSLMKSSASYTGKYDVDPAQTADGIKLTIHVDAATNQALTGTNRVFFMRVDGDKLTVKSPGVVVATSGATSTVHLEFVTAD